MRDKKMLSFQISIMRLLFSWNSSILLNIIITKVYCNMNHLKIDNVNFEYSEHFMFIYNLKNCDYDNPNNLPNYGFNHSSYKKLNKAMHKLQKFSYMHISSLYKI
jgi:hypothetical protein